MAWNMKFYVGEAVFFFLFIIIIYSANGLFLTHLYKQKPF